MNNSDLVIVDTNAWFVYGDNTHASHIKISDAIDDLRAKNRLAFVDVIAYEIWHKNTIKA